MLVRIAEMCRIVADPSNANRLEHLRSAKVKQESKQEKHSSIPT